MLKRISTEDARAKLDSWLKSRKDNVDARGRRWHWKRFDSRDNGCRVGKDGKTKKTYESPFAAEENAVKHWTRRQEEQGLALSQQDLADEFHLLMESLIFELRRQKEDTGFPRGMPG